MKRLLLQAVEFVGLSGIGWLLDFGTYSFIGLFSKNLFINNIISSLVGVTFVFVFATRHVFQNDGGISLKWKYVIYILYQCILIFCISKLLDMINTAIVAYVAIAVLNKFSAILSKILVTPITMILNFFVMKGVIEKI